MATQLGFDLPVRPALGRDDFLVAPSNAVALAMMDDWPKWAKHKLALTGLDHGPELKFLLPLIGPARAKGRLAGETA